MRRKETDTTLIPISRPYCDQATMKGFSKFYIQGKWGNGEVTKQFEQKFAEYLDPNKTLTALAVNTGTAAYHIALKVAGVTKDDEVITTALNNTSLVEAIRYNGAIPVFADVLYDSLNLDPLDVERKITPKTKVIVATHFSGSPCDIEALISIAVKNKLLIIEDCSKSIGGSYLGSLSNKKIGSLGHISCFPLNSTEPLSCGDGGMIVFKNNTLLEERIKQLRKISIDDIPGSTERNNDYLMPDVLAFIGLNQLEIIDRINENRKIGLNMYIDKLKKIRQIDVPNINLNKSCVGNFIVKLHGLNRTDLMEYLLAHNITTEINYKPIYLYSKYSKYNKNNTPITDVVWKTLLTLPLSPVIDSEVPYIIRTIKEYINNLLIDLGIKRKKEILQNAK